MWGYITAWVWLLLSLTMVGVLAVTILSTPTPPSAPDSRGHRSAGAPGGVHPRYGAGSSVTTPEPRREARHE